MEKQFYDQGWNARVREEPFDKVSTRSWQDGWRDCDEVEPAERTTMDVDIVDDLPSEKKIHPRAYSEPCDCAAEDAALMKVICILT